MGRRKGVIRWVGCLFERWIYLFLHFFISPNIRRLHAQDLEQLGCWMVLKRGNLGQLSATLSVADRIMAFHTDSRQPGSCIPGIFQLL
ncbi:hypothetical protein QBC42DRAFT_268082, partial [Cladorrhinum samala]